MKKMMRLAVSALVLRALFGPTVLEAQSEFPHEKHALFYPECSACHAGVTTGEWEGVYPELATCTACHDGSTAPQIDWTPPEGPRSSNLAFQHEPHGFGCAMCHVPEGDEDLSGLRFPRPSTCLGCHAPETESHLAPETPCSTCHVPAAKAPFSNKGMSGLPRPASHRFGDFSRSHRSAAATSPDYCAVCHTESTCTSCHDGQGSPAFHPLNFLASHAPEAYGRINDCSSCHSTEAFCRACHMELGMGSEGGIGGAYHNDDSLWILSHAVAARQDLESCVSCHQQTDCLRCHSAQSGLGVNPHGPDFNGSGISDRNKAMCTLCHISGG